MHCVYAAFPPLAQEQENLRGDVSLYSKKRQRDHPSVDRWPSRCFSTVKKKQSAGKLEHSWHPISKLIRADRNPKAHDIGAIATSIERFGFIAPIIINETTGKIVAGHGRLDTLQSLKAKGKRPPKNIKIDGREWLVPVVTVSFDSDAEAEAYLIADNRISEIGGWNDESLVGVLADLAAHDSLEGVGYDQDDLDDLLQNLTPTDVQEQQRLKCPKKPKLGPEIHGDLTIML